MMTYTLLEERIIDAENAQSPADDSFFSGILNDLGATAKVAADELLGEHPSDGTFTVWNAHPLDFVSDPANLLPSDSMGKGNSRIEEILLASDLSTEAKMEFLVPLAILEDIFSDLLVVSENDDSYDAAFLPAPHRKNR